MMSHCRRRRFGPAGILGFRATVTPRVSGSVMLSRWSHRFSIALQLKSWSKEGTFRFPPVLVNNDGSVLMLHFSRGCVNFFRYILR
jgi:hypothetical protein